MSRTIFSRPDAAASSARPHANQSWLDRNQRFSTGNAAILHTLLIPRGQEERNEDAICQRTAVANHIDPKSYATSVIAVKLWKGFAKGKSPKAFAICQGAATEKIDLIAFEDL